jgi:hypothetical protein
VKVECVMQNEQIDDLTTNYNLIPLLEQKWNLKHKYKTTSTQLLEKQMEHNLP